MRLSYHGAIKFRRTLSRCQVPIPLGSQNGGMDSDQLRWFQKVWELAMDNTNKLARGQTPDNSRPDPYKQTASYDVWNNVKFTGYQYGVQQSDSATYTNNRRSDQGYDADGNVTSNLAYGNTIDTVAHNVHAISNRMVGDGS